MNKPFIVAELSANHLGGIERALELVDVAASVGADAVKIQTWHEMAIEGHVIKSGPWAGRDLTDLYREAKTPWWWHRRIFDRCRERGIVGFSTPFDHESVDFLEMLDCPIYKIASFEITDTSLIQHVSRTGKPIVISTGMATADEIGAALEATYGVSNVTLLKCTSAYPAPLEAANLQTICDLRERFGCEVGVSDHTIGEIVPLIATALGASLVEKHLTLCRASGGPDAAFSSEPNEFSSMVRACREVAKALGDVSYGPADAERDSLQFRRGLWITRDVAAGDTLTIDNLRSMRPASSLPASRLGEFLGRKAKHDMKRGYALQEGDA